MKVKTHLISGTGNTFHIVYDNNRSFSSNLWTPAKMKDFAKRACQKNKADGFIFLEGTAPEQPRPEQLTEQPTEQLTETYKWHFFNNDGSTAEMCGNATRCVGYFIKNILKSRANNWNLLTAAGVIKISFISAEKYKVTMTPIKELKSGFGFYCDTGVPHLVLEKKDLVINEDLKTAAQKLRNHAEFSPHGTNVTYVVLEADRVKIKAVSYERGVENFTAACGTGAMAAAFYNLTKRGEKQTQVEMPG